jgi:hypothetical protein
MLAPLRVPVALVRRNVERSHRLDLTVKLTFQYDADSDEVTARLAEEQGELSGGVISELAGAADDELAMASDFHPLKERGEIMIVGHAHGEEASTGIAAGVAVDDIERAFGVASAEPALSAAIIRASLRSEIGEVGEAPVGPIVSDDAGDEQDIGGAPQDIWGAPQACEAQRGGYFSADATVELDGLDQNQPALAITLPGIQPVLKAQRRGGSVEPLALHCDTLWIDVDQRRIVASWRGSYRAQRRYAREVACMVLSLEPPAESDMPAPGSVTLAHYHYALQADDLERPKPRYSEDRLKLARYAVMGAAAEPALPLADYARIAAELAEQREPRDDLLKRHEWEPDAWLVEERAWMERIGDQASKGDNDLAVRFGELFVVAQDGLAREDEQLDLVPFAELKVQMESTENPAKLLEEREVSLASWLREQRRWDQQTQTDAKLQRELDKAIATQRTASRGTQSP